MPLAKSESLSYNCIYMKSLSEIFEKEKKLVFKKLNLIYQIKHHL